MIKKLFIVITVLLVGVAVYRACTRYFIPKIVVNTLTKNDSTSLILPKTVKRKINNAKKKVVPLTDSLIYVAHRQGITIDGILREIDKLEESQVNSFHDMLKLKNVQSADELFDLAKSSFQPEFDVEPFRKIYKANFTMAKYNELMEKVNKMRENPIYDFETAKLIAKQLVLDREEKFNAAVRNVEKTK
jgi:hypothetical protein